MADETTSDMPATTEDTANTMLDTATDLALDSTIPVPIRRNIFKALDRLGSALIDIPVRSLERRSAEKRAESEARIKITEAVNTQIVQQIKVDPEFPQRASNTFAKKILREQYNLEKILGFATDVLKKKEGFRLDNDILAICPNAAATPLLSLDKYNRFTKKCREKIRLIFCLTNKDR